MMKNKALLGVILFLVVIFGGSFLVMAQESPKVENFLGVKWGDVYDGEEWITIGDHSFISRPRLYKEMKKKGYNLGGFTPYGYLDEYYGYLGPYARDAHAEILFFFVNNKFYASEIYCFVDDGNIETQYENVKRLMIDKFGQPTSDSLSLTHNGGYTSVGEHWIGTYQQDKIDISCTLLKDSKGQPVAVFIQYKDGDLYTREGKQNEVL
jgi:hypothetical protein